MSNTPLSSTVYIETNAYDEIVAIYASKEIAERLGADPDELDEAIFYS